MKNEMVKVETGNKELTAQSVMQDLGISASDLMIPRVNLMQNTSERVGMGQAAFGDLINSLSGEKIGDFATPCEFIPIKVQKTWVIFDVSGAQPKFIRIDPMTAQNEKQPWEGVENGVKVRRDQSLDFHIVLAADIKKGEAFPYLLSFRRTSYAAGRALATHITKLVYLGKEMHSKVCNLKVERQKNETNVYAVLNVQPSRAATDEEKEASKMWIDLLKQNQYKTDDDTLVQTEAPTQKTAEKPAIVVGKSQKDDDILY